MSALRTTTRVAAALVGAVLLFAFAAPSAGAQDPYGSTTTTRVDDILATCGLSVPEGQVGDTVTATVDGVFLGENVRLFFDDVQVGATTAPVVAQSAGAPVVFGGAALPAQATVQTVSVDITFTVPAAAPGNHIITAVGDTFTCFCNPDGIFEVLAADAGGGSLPRTGIYLGLFLVVAAILLAVGRAMVVASRRRAAAGDGLDEVDEDADHVLLRSGR